MMPKIWLVGAGVMAQDYAKVLVAMGHSPVVIGRSPSSVEEFTRVTALPAVSGGLELFLKSQPALPSHAIVAVSRENLAASVVRLIQYGVTTILVEKPAALSQTEMLEVQAAARGHTVVIGFNRRFYASVLRAKEMIKEDGGVQSFHFEFTEWSHKLKDIVSAKGEAVMATWFLGNSIHVADLAFALGGHPQEISSYSAEGHLTWHSTSIFAGAGRAVSGALFSYHAHWESAGRWGVELLTPRRRLILKPLEELYVQELGSVQSEACAYDMSLDRDFKPGLYLQVQKFLAGELQGFSSLDDLANLFPTYLKMAGYESK